MSPHQRAQVADFLDRYRGAGSANSKLVISAPSGAPNEVSSMQAIAEMRHMIRESGFDETSVSVEAYHEDKDPQPPIRVSYMRYVAEAPECGRWPTNLAVEPNNLPYPHFGCATQRNFAMQVANPADLLGPRGETPRSGERRAVVWDKYTKGESTVADKKGEERVQVKGAQ
jgi:pilus assembly protein CpaD